MRPHQVQRDERPRPPPAVAAVHGDGAGGGVDCGEEGGYYGARRAGGFVEDEVVVLKAVRDEGLGDVARLLEADDGADPKFCKDVGVEGGAEDPQPAAACVQAPATAEILWPSERNDLARDNQVQVAAGRSVELPIICNVGPPPKSRRFRVAYPVLP